MRIFKHKTHYDFTGKRKPALFISSAINLAILVGLAIFGFNYGVDFAGGTVVEVRFDHAVGAATVRHRAESGGLKDVSVQGIGPAKEHTFLLKMGGVTQLTAENGQKAEKAIRALAPIQSLHTDLDDGLIKFHSKTRLVPAKVEQAVEATGVGVKQVRDLGVDQFGGEDYQVVASGMADKVNSALAKGMSHPDFKQLQVNYVGPEVGKQLRNRGVMALLYSMIAILIYVAFRFDFKFGPGALVAMVHDVIMVCGYYLVTRREFNLTSIAVLLTIVGYSVNDTIVVYDRVREEMVKFKGKPLPEIINIAVNDTLSRTILTSGVTAISLIGLLIYGVGEIFDFAAAMVLGIIVGTYSSIYIASTMTIWLDERAEAKKKKKASSGGATADARAA